MRFDFRSVEVVCCFLGSHGMTSQYQRGGPRQWREAENRGDFVAWFQWGESCDQIKGTKNVAPLFAKPETHLVGS